MPLLMLFTSIFNLMRNIGASIGISMVQTIQIRHSHTCQHAYRKRHPQQSSGGKMSGMKSMMMAEGGGVNPANAQRIANDMIEKLIRQQAAIMSFK